MKRWRWKRIPLSLLWDGFMVYLATVNVLLILFNFTYLWMRPFYVKRMTWVANVYDPVLGIEAHPFSERYLAAFGALEEALRSSEPARAAAPSLESLRQLSVDMLEENPFALSRPRNLERIKYWFLHSLDRPPIEAADQERVEEAFHRFWSWDGDALPPRVDLFRRKVAPLLRSNYFRSYDPDGDRLVDHFWRIDLPFLLLFAVEFMVRWGLALRRRLYPRWYHFPIFNWYDVLGLIPYFRLFRLFRIVSIYVRLQRSELTRVGDDVLSRGVKFVSRAIAEEISDMVTVRILESAQDRIREGTYAEIVLKTLIPQRDAIRTEVVDVLGQLVSSDALRASTREFLRLNLDQSIESSEALRGIPLPDAVLRPLVRSLGDSLYRSLVKTLTDTLESEAGRDALEEAVDTILEVFLVERGAGELEALIEEIAMEILERTKATVQVREWAGETWRPAS